MSRVGFLRGAAHRRLRGLGYIALHQSPRLEWRPEATGSPSSLREQLETALRVRERSRRSPADPTTALRDTVEAIWTVVERAARERARDHDIDAVLARRELVRCGTHRLSLAIRRGVASGAFWPACPPWAIRRLPFALVAGACAQWVFGLSRRPALRASVTVQAMLEVLRPHV